MDKFYLKIKTVNKTNIGYNAQIWRFKAEYRTKLIKTSRKSLR